MTDTISFKPALIQHGLSTAGSWTDLTLPDAESAPGTFAVGALETYVQVYDFEIILEAERSLVTPSRHYFTQASQSLFFDLLWPTADTSIPSDILGYFYVSDAVTSTWSSSNLASSASKLIINPPAPPTFKTDDLTWTLNSNGTTYDQLIPLDFNASTGVDRPPIPKTTIMTHINKPTWDGKLTLLYTRLSNWTLNNPSDYSRGYLTGQYVPYYTGWDNSSADRGRPIPDMRSGLPAFAEDLVEDGYSPGIWTSSSNWDPIDPRDVHPVEFPPNEGVKKDDVPV